MLEEPRQRAHGDRRRGDSPCVIEMFVGRREWLFVRPQDRQRNQPRSRVPSERVRLVRPVQVPQGARIPEKVMLGLLVIPNDLGERIGRLHTNGLLSTRLHLCAHAFSLPQSLTATSWEKQTVKEIPPRRRQAGNRTAAE